MLKDTRNKIKNCNLSNNLITFCKWLVASWASKIVIHWRTVKQAYSWLSNWHPIYELKDCLDIPVIWNWDIKTVQDALNRIWNLDWIYIWRACIWDPWIFRRLTQAFNWEEVDGFPEWEERRKWAIEHVNLNVWSKWEKKWMLEMRKHLALYVKGLPAASALRNKLVRVETQKEAISILKEI